MSLPASPSASSTRRGARPWTWLAAEFPDFPPYAGEFEPVEAGQKAGEEVGTLVVRLGEQEQRVPLTLAADLPDAGLSYKLTRF